MVAERKPLSLPPPVIFAPRAVHTTLENAHALIPPPLPPTPPPPPYDPTAPLPSAAEILAAAQSDITADLASNGQEQEKESLNPSSAVSEAPTSKPQSLNIKSRVTRAKSESTGLPAKKNPYYDFVYSDRDTLENEINEFYSYHDKPQLLSGRSLFHSSFNGGWRAASRQTKVNYVKSLLECFDLKIADDRYIAAKKLLYISQGVVAETASKEEQLRNIVEYNKMLFDLGALDSCYGALKVASHTLDVISRASDSHMDRQAHMDLANNETIAYLNLMSLIVEVNFEDERLINEMTESDPPLVGYLFNLVAQLGEGTRKHYPVKKLLLLLWKVLMASVGDSKRIKELTEAHRILEGLPPVSPESITVKSTPQDYHNYHLIATTKYPAYVTPGPEFVCPPGLTLAEQLPTSIRRQLQQEPVIQPFIDVDVVLPSTFQESIELYRKHNYISLYTVQVAKERDLMDKDVAIKAREGISKERDGKGDGVRDLKDDLDDDSVSNLGTERRRDLFAMRPSLKNATRRIDKADAHGLKRIESLYRYLYPNLEIHIGMLIRLLYYVNIGNTAPPGAGKQDGENAANNRSSNGTTTSPQMAGPNGWLPDLPMSEMTPEQKHEYLERTDLNRHKEIVTKAVTGIILFLIKATKCQHALKFEYVSQQLIDNNCAILILKMLSTWLQNPPPLSPTRTSGTGSNEPGGAPSWGPILPGQKIPIPPHGMGAAWLTARQEPAELNFFHFCREEEHLQNGHSEHVDLHGNAEEQELPNPPDSPAGPTLTNGAHAYNENAANTSKAETFSDLEEDNLSPLDTRIPSSFRNFFTTINLLRILQKLTKRKTHRILALVQWKASAVLKRAMKVNHIGLQLYSLKLLKSQIPLLGKKWRSSNMKVITAIFLHLRPYLKDDYLAGDVDVDVDEALDQETYLRDLIKYYNEGRYGKPKSEQAKEDAEAAEEGSHVDELELILSASRRESYSGTNEILASHTRDPAYHDHIELDANFMENYEQWLQHEVYETESLSPTDDWNGPNEGWGPATEHGVNGTDMLHSSPRSLFSATRRFSKEMLGDDYDDTEWSWDSGDAPGDFLGVNPWDEPVENLLSPEGLEDEERRWVWHSDTQVTYEDSSDSGLGSLEDDEEEEDEKEKGHDLSEDKYFWPDELPVQNAYVEVFDGTRDGDNKKRKEQPS